MLPKALQSFVEDKRIFITGGTGTLGKWLIHELKDVPCQLVILTRNSDQALKSSSGCSEKNVTFVEGDVRDFDYPQDDFDYIIHAATPVVSDQISDAELTDIIVSGTRRILDFASHTGCKRLLFVSSGAVYGEQPTNLGCIPETHPCNPVSAYGKGKLVAENRCKTSTTDCVIARCFAFVGPDMPLDAHFAIGNFIGNCLKNEPISIRGDGSSIRSYLYSSDLAEWLLQILHNGRSGDAYNVGSNEAISIASLANLVKSVARTDNCIQFESQKMHEGAASRYVPCVEKVRQELNLSSRTSIRDSVDLTLSWFEKTENESCY